LIDTGFLTNSASSPEGLSRKSESRC